MKMDRVPTPAELRQLDKGLTDTAHIRMLEEQVRELLSRVARLEQEGARSAVPHLDLKARGSEQVGRVYFDGTTGVTVERIR